MNFILSGSAVGSGFFLDLRFLRCFRWVALLAASPPSLDVLVVLLVWLVMSEVRVRSVMISVMVGQMSAVRGGSVVGVVRMSVSETCLVIGPFRCWV